MTREQYKYLRKIRRKETNIPIDAIDSLCELGYAKREIKSYDDDGYAQYSDIASITTLGMEALENKRRDTFRFWFPSIIAVLALIVSIASVVLSISL